MWERSKYPIKTFIVIYTCNHNRRNRDYLVKIQNREDYRRQDSDGSDLLNASNSEWNLECGGHLRLECLGQCVK